MAGACPALWLPQVGLLEQEQDHRRLPPQEALYASTISQAVYPIFGSKSLASILDILVGSCIDISAFPIRGFFLDSFALLRYLIDELMI
jgi:hypothetical protein